MEIIRSLNWVDILVIIVVFRISYVAFQEGLSHEIFPVIGAVATLIVTLNYYNKIGGLISENLIKMPPEISNFLSFLILAVITGLGCKLLKAILDKIIHVEWHPLIERFGGLIFGIARAFITTSLVIMIIALMPLSYLQRSIRDKSVTGMHVLRIGPAVYEKASRLLPAVKGKTKTPSISKDDIVKDLISEKSIATKKVTKKEKTKEDG